MRRSWSKFLLVSAIVAASLVAAAPASAGPPWALITPTSGTVTGLVGDCRPIGSCTRGHAGIDIANRQGTNVYAAYRGTAYDGYSSGYGNYVDVAHVNGYMTRYAHLSSDLIGDGQRVERGTHIGEMGSTGGSTGNHLHFELRHSGNPLDINSAFRRNSFVSAGTRLGIDTYLVADADFAPFGNELAFVAQQYRDFLRRNIDGPAAAFWIDRLWTSSGVDVIHAIYSSPEAAAKISGAVRMYYAAFGRHPDNGVKSWLNKPLTDVARGLILSDEGRRKLPADPEDFVRQVYRFAFGREARSNEVTFWATVVRNEGRSRALVGISESNEHKERRYGKVGVNLGYIAMLNRVPDVGARNYWDGRIQYARGFAERDMIAVIRASSEYRNRVN